MKNFENWGILEKAQKEVLGNAIYTIADCFGNIKVFERNYIYTGLGKYEFICKLKQLDKDKYLIDFRINNRIDNKNLFQWDYYYKGDEVSKRLLNNLEMLFNLYKDNYNEIYHQVSKLIEVEKDEIETLVKEKLKKKEDELISKLSKEIFEARYNEFMETIYIVFENEFNEVYTLKDLYSGKYFFDKSKLDKDDIIGNYPILDDFCLYYVIDKNKDDDRIEILGFYSLYYNDFSEHIGENKDIKSILIGQRNLDENDFTKAVVDLYEF